MCSTRMLVVLVDVAFSWWPRFQSLLSIRLVLPVDGDIACVFYCTLCVIFPAVCTYHSQLLTTGATFTRCKEVLLER